MIRICSILALLLWCSLVASAAQPRTFKAMLLDGQNNHDWRSTSPVIKAALEQSGRFAVTVVTAPATTAEDQWKTFQPNCRDFDVVVSNFTDFGAKPTPQEFVDAVLSYVREGGAYVKIHAASFEASDEHLKMVGLGWKDPQAGARLVVDDTGRVVRTPRGGGPGTGHGPKRPWMVTLWPADHPVCAGLPRVWAHVDDELWYAVRGPAENLQVLATAEAPETKLNEPVVWTVQYGKGRVFATLMGHDADSMRCAGFQAILVRGCEWAITGEVTQPVPADFPTKDKISFASPAGASLPADLVERLKRAQPGASRAVESALREVVKQAMQRPSTHAAVEQQLLAILESDATPEGKELVCRQLWVAGTARSVPALAKLVLDERLSDVALLALRTNPDPSAGTSLIDAADKARGKLLIGIVALLGDRREGRAVPRLEALAKGDDPAVATAAITALGAIGTPEAGKALLGLPRGPAVAEAMLRCADLLAAAGANDPARELCQTLWKEEKLPLHIRSAAVMGLARTSPEQAESILVKALEQADGPVIARNAVLLRTLPGRRLMQAAVGTADRLPPDVLLIAVEALADRGDPEILPAFIKLLAHPSPPVRLAAMRGIGQIEGADPAVSMLTRIAGSATGADREEALAALARMRGGTIEGTIIAALGDPDPARKLGVIRALALRQSRAAVPSLLKAAGEGDASVRIAALDALGELAEPVQYPAILALLADAADDAARAAAEKAALAVARRMESNAAAVTATVTALQSAPPGAKPALIRLLGRLGGDQALAAVRQSLGASDATLREAAVRVLAEWSDESAAADLLKLAKDSSSEVHRTLALRGYLRLARTAKLDAAGRLQMVQRVRELARTPAEKSLLLAALADAADPAILSVVASYLEDEQAKREAAIAALKIGQKLIVTDPRGVREAMRKLIASTREKELLEQATALGQRSANIAPTGKASSPDGIDRDGDAGDDQAGIDGDPKTYWDEADGKSEYRYVVTLPESRPIAGIGILGFQHHQYAPKDFDVIVDGQVVKQVKDAAYTENYLHIPLAGGAGKVIELRITGSYGPSPAIRELGIYEPWP